MNLSLIILLLIIIIVIYVVYYNVGNRDMTYVKSDIDSEYYMVRNEKEKKKVANLLAKLKENIYAFSNYLYKKLNELDQNSPEFERYQEFKPYILQLKMKIKNVIVRESSTNSVYTSYTINKGEQIIFCVRSKSIMRILNSSDIHNINLVMYVALHEISHVACPEYNHTDLFMKIFHFFCEEAIEMGIYHKIDFNNSPREYCGMTITDSII